MPTAPDKLRNTMRLYFGGSGIDHYAPLQFLKESGWQDRDGTLLSPNRNVTDKEWECVDFLIQEWDFAYDASRGAANH